MLTKDLDFSFPKELIALEPSRPCRVAFVAPQALPVEMNLGGLLNQFAAGDLLVINETKVIPARVFSVDEIEVLFLKSLDSERWEVLFQARDFKPGDVLRMPYDLTLTLESKGLPQIVKLSRPIDEAYLQKCGEVALPPYIQQARGQRHNRAQDLAWYQTDWAQKSGSIAAPTASLHFQASDLDSLRARGVKIAKITLHVGAGTFLPVRSEILTDHTMHAEPVEISPSTMKQIAQTKQAGRRVWALGTTVARALESQAHGLLNQTPDGGFAGATQLFVYPPFQFRTVDVLMTNFHQPKSTLFGLVAAFAGLEQAHSVYAWAIERRFRLFSYGDLSVWMKP